MQIPDEEFQTYVEPEGLSEDSYPFVHGQDGIDVGDWYGLDEEVFADFADLHNEQCFENSLTLSLEFLGGKPWVKICFGLEEQSNVANILDPFGADPSTWNPVQTRIFQKLEELLDETQSSLSLHQQDLKKLWNREQDGIESGEIANLGSLQWMVGRGLARILSHSGGEVYLKQGEISLLNASLIPEDWDGSTEI